MEMIEEGSQLAKENTKRLTITTHADSDTLFEATILAAIPVDP